MADKAKGAGDELSERFEDDVWAVDLTSGPSLATRLIAEFVGTLVFMLVGLGTSAYAFVVFPSGNGSLGVGIVWGFAVIGMIVAIGTISGAHMNPAVTVALWVAGRFPGRDVALYALAQTAGAVLGAGGVAWFVSQFPLVGRAGVSGVMQQISIGYGGHSPAGVGLTGALAAEFVATGLLAAVVLAATSVDAPKGYAPVAIGFALAVLVTMTIPFTNAALNPARATGTAVFAGDWALAELWAWWFAPILGAAVVGLLFRAFGPEADLEPEAPEAK